ncbi:uncharacterized protein A4U43_C02F1680 [Asparagus officinalis]|uniref:Uncharacterized protein n=1 Tax=Asparagus officinalis TaxID=4686 RepID=A0A5P1FK56_ASPOF|nr:uncharacterized protein A4U43_C02F1680 [Asparagus officinalis]
MNKYVKCIVESLIYITVQLHLDSNFGGFRSSPSSCVCNRTWRRSELTRRAWGHDGMDGGARQSDVGLGEARGAGSVATREARRWSVVLASEGARRWLRGLARSVGRGGESAWGGGGPRRSWLWSTAMQIGGVGCAIERGIAGEGEREIEITPNAAWLP